MKTVVGIFEYESDAQNAQNYLLANGFGDGDVDIKTASYKSEETEPHVDSDDNLFERIGNFFQELFNEDHDEREQFTEAGKRGTIVTVHAESADEAVAAAHIMDEYGALDVTNGKSNPQPGVRYEDLILNPASVSDGDKVTPKSVDARGVYLKSRIIDRPLLQEHRLRQRPFSAGDSANVDPAKDTAALNKTIDQRDALINEIVENDELKEK
ncbi:hypothetical protein [Dyadobacter bucti]|uniref:hypothetical protein n=1 Tax=Dyadobacter bucti TaxID=2572203 RepID=UPI003F7121A3